MSSSVLLLGSRGFIGRHVRTVLEAAGYRVRCADRPAADLARDHDPRAWAPWLEGVDVVVNAVGIFREHGRDTFEAVHAAGPAALFEACAAARVKVVQVSALGADEGAASAFHRSKRHGDERLLGLDVDSIVLQPSLVQGAGGASASLFATLASLPWIPLPGSGEQRIQPVRVEDVAQAVASAIERGHFPRARLAVVGPEAMTLRAFLARVRRSLDLGSARFLRLPRGLVALASRLRVGLLDAESLAMLERGNVADAAPLRALLGRDPLPVPERLEEPARSGARLRAQLAWLLPLARVALAIVWITAGIVSMGPYPVADSLQLLERTGLRGTAAYVALYGAATLDLALGLATLLVRRARWLWVAQGALVLAYTGVITVFLPEQWLHPYGPVVKNLPILALLLLLCQLERR